MSGRIQDLAVYEADPRIFFVASASGGLWKTENGGNTFTALFDRENTVSLGAASVAQSNPDVVYVGTGEASSRNSVAWGDGVYKSTDGGKTWANVGLKETHHISAILIHPKNPDIVYVGALGRLWGTNKERGVYKTTDGGKTWRLVLHVNEKTGVGDLQMDPKNPEVLLCAMWQRIRRPYDFTSGGPGSGLWKTRDGGKNWSKITRGLPGEGPLGRIGLSYMRSKPNIVIATVEFRPKTPPAPAGTTPTAAGTQPAPQPATPPATEAPATPPQAGQPRPGQRPTPAMPRFNGGGVFRSTDGGDTWKQIANLNPRPFYFSRPKQDPVDENRFYVCAINVHLTQDMGKTFRTIDDRVHPDHHSIWIDPSNPNHILLGTDGGVYESRDRGENWRHFNNMPLGQFYAVTADMQRPYWVYGGLQDNGSWGMPSQGRKGGPGWWDNDEVGGGDGFYVQVDPTDPFVLYSESQGGAIGRLDRRTGARVSIRPRAPQGETYRFNWSSPFLLSPHNPRTLYFGGNKLFKSGNRGDTWAVISPDLTTNNPEKQKPGRNSVTPEDTGAERHCTITTLTESPIRPGVLYVGTDDGLVHGTRDDGKTWTNLTQNIPDLPANTWCSRVTASKHVEGRVYATFDGHRENDFRPYVFTSEDFGATWTKLHDSLPEGDCTYVIREGERNPNLLFLGSEMSLRVSMDRGKSWERFRTDFPTVAVHDLFVHPRDMDLIIGTHGRSIWTLDISALEQMTPQALEKDINLFDPQSVLRLGSIDGLSWSGDGVYRAVNSQPGTRIFYRLKSDAKEDPVITIENVRGDLKQEFKGAKAAGLNVLAWNGTLGGRSAPIGEYRVTLRVDGQTFVTSVRVEEAFLGL
jgi:photosystem II stability/assembly factor-like uncharacterized protein